MSEVSERLKVPLWLLTLFTFSGTLAMHIFVPALPHAAEDLGASISTMQMTVSLYILGLAFGQLIYGPASDRFGRRPTLMVGLAVYAVAGLAAALAPSAHELIAARLFQALGGCAGLVLGRTIVRDTSSATDSAKRLAVMNLMVTVGPAVAPLLGAGLADTLGWRSIFYMLSAFGLFNLIFAWRLLPETAPPSSNSGGGAFLRHGAMLLKSPAFLGFSVGGGCATTAMYAFVASAPFIFTRQLGRPAHEVGFYLAFMIFGIWLGSAIVSRLIGRVPMEKLLIRGNLLSAVAALTFLATVLTGQLSVAATMACMFGFTMGVGIASPPALTLAMSVNSRVIGSASGLYGCIQMSVGAVCTALAGLGSNPALAAASVLAVAGLVAQGSFWMALRKSRTTALR
ncbi:MAG: Bcr/CflA family drug resistance efflux transporter [Rubritepida sp.]|nr:Bcr/CflA family drug resistance efflux transporter [Rubritepida sp.]